MLDRAERGEPGLGWTLWQPFIIEAWRRYFVAPLASAGAAPRDLLIARSSGAIAAGA